MKKYATPLVFAALLPVYAASAQQKTDVTKKPAAEVQAAHRATGVVKKVDPMTGLITIAHEAVGSLNWPAMTMDFMVKDKALLEKFSVGKKADFEFVRSSEGYVITGVK